MEISGKTAIVTGGIRGIGFEIVKHLLNKGVKHVAIFDQSEVNDKTVIAVISELDGHYGQNLTSYHRCDVSDQNKFLDLYKKVTERQGFVDILINNAGIGNENKADKMIDTNMKAVITGSLTAIEHMGRHKSGKGGVIINVSSAFGLVDLPLLPVYSATKHAVVSFGRCMKTQFKVTGVRVITVCPHSTETHLTNADNVRECILEFFDKDLATKLLLSCTKQSPKNVASAVTQLIEQADSGSVWLSQFDQPPIEIPSTDQGLQKLMKMSNL